MKFLEQSRLFNYLFIANNVLVPLHYHVLILGPCNENQMSCYIYCVCVVGEKPVPPIKNNKYGHLYRRVKKLPSCPF